MNENTNYELKKAIGIHQAMLEYRDEKYINLISQINDRTQAILTDDMGSQFVQNCGRDLAGEVVRNFFDTSSYNITVDQLATRILKFSYEDEYDPLTENGGVGELNKRVYNYNELTSKELSKIANDIDASQEKLFHKQDGSNSYDNQYFIDKRKNEYREKQKANSVICTRL